VIPRETGGINVTRIVVIAAVGGAALLLLGLLVVPMLIVGGTSLLFGRNGGGCTGSVTQPGVSTRGRSSIPSDYLMWYQRVGQQYGIPWTILAGIGTVESDNGQTTLPGVHSGTNAFGAAGPMQIGVDGAAGNQWGGAPVHPASETVSGVATDENGDGTASVYEPADAIAGAAKYLIAHGVQSDVSSAVFAYNHLTSYVQDVLSWSSTYATGGFTVAKVTGCSPANQVLTAVQAPNQTVASAIAFAEAQLGKPYAWGSDGPDAFDCSGLVMMAYRSAGVYILRTSQEQWASEPRVAPAAVEPGDLVFFAGADGKPTAPGHVGIVIGKNRMIEAYATGFPVRISSYGLPSSPPGDQTVVGFTRPWANASDPVVGSSSGAVAAGG
jgi:peptidoglycan DL-endopeptidase CwlO